jgi:hypothetical protein
MANIKIANSEAISACDAVVDAIDDGTGAGKLRIFSGTQPTNADDTKGTGTLLAELTLNDPAFGNAADDNPGGKATANAISDDTSANASGTASWFRAVTSGATASAAGIIDGDVGTTAGFDLNLDSTNIASGATVSVTSWTITMPES